MPATAWPRLAGDRGAPRAHETHERLARKALGPDGPAEAILLPERRDEQTVDDPDYFTKPWVLDPVMRTVVTDPNATLYAPLPCNDIDHLHVVRNHIFFEPLRNDSSKSRFKIQQQLILQAEDIEIALHFALCRHEGRVAAFAHAQALHVVRHLAVQKTHAVRAGQTNPAAATQVKDACAFSQRGMFGE